MTTSVTVKVNGKYVATVAQDSKPPIEVRGGDEKTFEVSGNAETTLRIIERPDETAKS